MGILPGTRFDLRESPGGSNTAVPATTRSAYAAAMLKEESVACAAALLLALIQTTSAQMSFFDAGSEWSGPGGRRSLLDPEGAEAATRAGGFSPRWARDALACARAPANATCSPAGFVAASAAARVPTTAERLCADLGRTNVLFVGDSFTRHVFAATALLLSGDHESGALRNGSAGDRCGGARQFGEADIEGRRACRRLLPKRKTLCGGSVRLRLVEGTCPAVTERDLRRNQIVAFGIGAHPCEGPAAKGAKHNAYNATSLAAFLGPVCGGGSSDAVRALAAARLVWLDTHFRATSYGPYDGPDRVRAFHDGAPAAVAGACGGALTVSAFDESRALVATEGSGWRRMTYDGTHWGPQVNALKAFRLLDVAAARRGGSSVRF